MIKKKKLLISIQAGSFLLGLAILFGFNLQPIISTLPTAAAFNPCINDDGLNDTPSACPRGTRDDPCTQNNTCPTSNPCINDDGFNDPPSECPSGTRDDPCTKTNTCPGGGPTSPPPTTPTPNTDAPKSVKSDCKDKPISKDNCGILKYLVNFINVLSALVGIVVVTMVAIGGIQYTASRENPQATAAAKSRIFNAIMALVIYIFLFSILQWLVPGGIFNG